jgi:hypothetical protein
MKLLLAIAIMAAKLSVAPAVAAAEERLGDGTMGAAAGALVAIP